MPILRANPDVYINELYVSQSITSSYLKPDVKPPADQLRSPILELLNARRLVVLGDPGCGKSTLINFLAWYLSSGFVKKLPGELACLLPVPIVLRDLVLTDVETFDDLLQAFMQRPVAKELNEDPAVFKQYLQAGKGLFLIDGLDEVSPKLRQKIRDVILQGFIQYADCFFLCTSRVVGYDDAPLSYLDRQKQLIQQLGLASDQQDDQNLGVREKEALYKVEPTHAAFEPTLCYVAPLDNNQIATFAMNWYREQGSPMRAGPLRRAFLEALAKDPGTTRLARNPNLLTMMALIFKIRTQLPNGRAMLYQDIAQAYLESIDNARRLTDPIPWQKKKTWLARVGFEMQLRRSTLKKDDQELLATHAEVLAWIKQAMLDTGDNNDDNNNYAEQYLDWIARRSGLLLPRGEDQFAFMHLSFQEYFAAVYIQFQIKNPAWLDLEISDDEDWAVDPRINKTILADWADDKIWQQPLIFLFELFDGKQGWSNRLWRYCFPDDIFERQRQQWQQEKKRNDLLVLGHSEVFNLQITLLADPHAGITDKTTSAVLAKLAELATEQQDALAFAFIWGSSTLLARLLSEQPLQSMILQLLENNKSFKSLKSLNLNGFVVPNMTELLDKLFSFISVTSLNISDSALIDLSPLTQLIHLEALIISDTKVKDITPLIALTNLTELVAFQTEITDFSPLAKHPNIKRIIVDKDSATNFEGIDPNIIIRY